MGVSKTSRRTFFKWAALSGTAAGSLRRLPARQRVQGANDRIQIALIGAGGRGMSITRAGLEIPGVRLVAAADLYQGRRIRTQEVFGKDVHTTGDYREILQRRDVDAVLVATSDHWHAPICREAMQAGKDVYCEKPMVHSLPEGRQILEVQKETGRVLQVGSQRVSSILYQKARELLARGDIGTLTLVEGWISRNSALGAWQYSIPPDASPRTIDWDRFLGPAPSVPFDPRRFFRWRNYWDYGTGIPGDLFVHLFSGLHFVLGTAGPRRVQATGGLRYWKDDREVPDVMLGLYDYPESPEHPAFNLLLRVNFADASGDGSGLRFVGSEGVLTLNGEVSLSHQPRPPEPGYRVGTFAREVQEAFLREYRKEYPERPPEVRPRREEIYRAPEDYNSTVDHFQNFFQAVRSRGAVVEDALFGFRAAAPALLSNISYREKRVCNWDPHKLEQKPLRERRPG